MTQRPAMDHFEAVAKRKAWNIDGWEICTWEATDNNDLIVEGGIPAVTPKGRKHWDEDELLKVVVTEAEAAAEQERYERETGNCGECMGKAEVFAFWSATEGTQYRTCPACQGSGFAFFAVIEETEKGAS